MPNGRPGDHPLTDILNHDMPSTFPPDIVEEIKRMAGHPRFAQVSDRVSEILWNNWPMWKQLSPEKAEGSDLDAVRASLEEVRRELEKQT